MGLTYTMKILITIIFLTLLTDVQAEECPLSGYWKSDEAKTLISFKAADKVTQKQKELLTNNFFGKLFVHIDCKTFTSVFEGRKETSEYIIVDASKEKVVMRYDSALKGVNEMVATIEGPCYSVLINDGQFREYFCPSTEQAYNKAVQQSTR